MRSPRHTRNLIMAALLSGLAGLVVLVVAFTRLQAQAFIKPRPVASLAETPADYGLAYEEVALTAADGTQLAAWYVLAAQGNGAAMVLVHGLGANRAALLPTARILVRHGYGVLLLDLRAHGQSEGEFLTYGYYESDDVLAALAYLNERPEVQSGRIGLLGTSMGAAAAIRAAAGSDIPQAMVIESTYSSLPAAVNDAFGKLSLLPAWPFAPLVVKWAEREVGVDISQVDSARDLAGFAPRSVLLIHGTADDLFPLEHHRRLFQSARGPKEQWIVEGMGHESPALFAPKVYEQRLIDFLDRHLNPRPSS